MMTLQRFILDTSRTMGGGHICALCVPCHRLASARPGYGKQEEEVHRSFPHRSGVLIAEDRQGVAGARLLAFLRFLLPDSEDKGNEPDKKVYSIFKVFS